MRLNAFDPITDSPGSEQYSQQSIAEEYNEQILEDWLHANPTLLVDEPVLIFGRQTTLDTGVSDLLGIDQYGNVSVFEIKVGRSGSGSASEETILSQPQNYAQALASHSYEDLNRIYHGYCEQMADGKWDIKTDEETPETLAEAFESQFGRRLEADQFNDRQRLVIVAETITARTRRNARYLLEQGLNIQCQEVRLFDPPGDGSPILTTSVVVDYPLSNVRPVGKGHPAYPEINRMIVERTFPEIADIVNVETPYELVKGFDERQPRIQSRNPDHPESVTYRLYVNPEQDSVLIALDIRDTDESAVARVQENSSAFSNRGFEVTGNKTHRVIMDIWLIESIDEFDETLLDEIASRYATLVQVGHDVFVNTTA